MNLFRKPTPDLTRRKAIATPASASSPAPLPPAAAFPALTGRNAGIGIPEVHGALRELVILLHNKRLYHHTHPKNQESLDHAYDNLQRLAQNMNGLEIRIERDAIVVPKLSEAPVPDPKGELRHLALDFQLAGIQTLVILRQFHVGELDTLAQLIRASLLKSDAPSKRNQKSWWSAKLLEFGVEVQAGVAQGLCQDIRSHFEVLEHPAFDRTGIKQMRTRSVPTEHSVSSFPGAAVLGGCPPIQSFAVE